MHNIDTFIRDVEMMCKQVLVDVPVTSRVWKEEIFGPVLCIRVSKGYSTSNYLVHA